VKRLVTNFNVPLLIRQLLSKHNSRPIAASRLIVSVSTSLYIALQNSTNQNPASTTGYWQLLKTILTK
jgi:hypothetical protein